MRLNLERSFLIACRVLVFLLLTSFAGAQNWGSPVWSDEFNGAAGSSIDSTKWTYDTGNLGVNDELEWYCAPGSSISPCNPSNPNAYIDGNGHLVIQAIRITSSTAAGSNAWTSARLNTSNSLANFEYGRIEASMQLPIGPGLWPAFWALGTDIGTVGWPASGEMDFMENVPAGSGQGPGIISSTIHGPGYSGANGLSRKYNFPNGAQVNTAFHTYGAIWSPYMIEFYVDDPTNIFFVRTAGDIPSGITWPFNNNFFLLMNLAVGGVGSWPGPPDATTPSPALMLVDYVRAYQAAPIIGPTMSASPITVAAGATGTSTINLSSTSGTGRVYLTCSGAPAKATCNVNTNDALDSYVVDFSNSTTGTATVNVTTTANTSAMTTVPPIVPRQDSLRAEFFGLLNLLGMAVGFVLIKAPLRSVKPFGIASVVLISALLMLASCGGGSNTTTTSPPASNGTPPGSYSLTVTAYTVSGGTSTVTVPLTVN